MNVYCKHCGKEGVNAGDDRIVITSELGGKKIKDAFHFECFTEIAGDNYIPQTSLETGQEVYGQFTQEQSELLRQQAGIVKNDLLGISSKGKLEASKIITMNDVQRAWKEAVDAE